MKFYPVVGVVLLCTAISLGQTAPEKKGAKALYYDTTSQVTVAGATGQAAGQKAVNAVAKKASSEQQGTPNAPALKANTGLMYYVELIKPNGELLRVNTSRAFRSGEKIRLHFQSNMNGRLVILQRQQDGTAQKLYPDMRINGGDNKILAGVDTVIPSKEAWFTFDNNPGEERIMVFLTTESSYGAISAQVATPTINNDNAGRLASRITQQQHGSKALVLEVDDKSESPATYAVAPVPQASANPDSEIVALEIVLNHQK
jgi:hypothetical protein